MTGQAYHNTRTISHVRPNDGRDLREHPFFEGLDWGKLHSMKPPFIPEGLKGTEDTKYFNEDYFQSTSVNSSSPNQQSPSSLSQSEQPKPLLEVNNEYIVHENARDQLLQDPVHGKELLELRKEVAFWGYTYRRPKTLGTEVTGRRRVTMAGITPTPLVRGGTNKVVPSNKATDTGGYSRATLGREISEIGEVVDGFRCRSLGTMFF